MPKNMKFCSGAYWFQMLHSEGLDVFDYVLADEGGGGGGGTYRFPAPCIIDNKIQAFYEGSIMKSLNMKCTLSIFHFNSWEWIFLGGSMPTDANNKTTSTLFISMSSKDSYNIKVVQLIFY